MTMKKMMVAAVCTLSVMMHGAEESKKLKNLTLSIGGTTFCVAKDDMYKHDASFDCMIFGNNQQVIMGQTAYDASIGWIHSLKNKIRVLPKDADSVSDDDSYQPWLTKDLYKKAEDKTLECNVFAIEEPRIMYQAFKYNKPKTYGYWPSRPCPGEKNSFLNPKYYGDEAIAEGCKDLQICYSTSLQHGLDVLGDRDDKKIALASLGVDVGFPRHTAVLVAFNTIVEFLKNNPGKYELVQLFIKKRSEFALLGELVRNYLAQEQ
jgi:hypothetical protein